MKQKLKIFDNVRNWIFDLDNTIYQADKGLDKKIGSKITQYIQKYLKLDEKQARQKQKYYFKKYGTTLRGLMNCYNIDPHEYLDFVYLNDLSALQPDKDYADIIQNLPGKKYIMTNASAAHAEAVLQQIGISNAIDAVFGIVEANFHPKPQKIAYDKICQKYQIEPQKAAMFEDMIINLQVPAQIGMITIHIQQKDQLQWDEKDQEKQRQEKQWVNFTTESLKDFLQNLTQSNNRDNP